MPKFADIKLREDARMAITIETRAGDVVVMASGLRAVTTDGVTYYDVRVNVRAGGRDHPKIKIGEVSIGDDGRAIGDSRDAWVSGNILALLDEKIPSDEHRAVLDAIEHAAGRLVLDHVRVSP